jgi:aminoglycoside phosphotransferase (APT) family kinase protein/RimJ/RimL family protein N-acetyltransferase
VRAERPATVATTRAPPWRNAQPSPAPMNPGLTIPTVVMAPILPRTPDNSLDTRAAAGSNGHVRIVPLTAEHAAEIQTWRYPAPYERYAMTGPLPVDDYWALVEDTGELIGFRCFGPEGRVPGYAYDDTALDTGGGLRPDLTGRGRGAAAIATGLAYGWERFRNDDFRVTVAAFNTRAQRAVEALGFRPEARFRATTNGEEYVVLRLATAPVVIDEAMVRRLVASQFPRWSGLPVRPVGKPGWDNMTFRLGDELSVRLPRFARWIGQVHREQRWLPRLAPRLPLAIPEAVAQGAPGEGYPFPWSIYRWRSGENADLSRAGDPAATAVELAGFFAALQATDATGGPPPEWSNGFRGVPIPGATESPVDESYLLERIHALDGLVDTAALIDVYETARAAPPWTGPPVWIHGDPDPANMLMSDGKLSAVIDFGTLAVGDPATDLIAAWTFLDAETRPIFRAALEVDDATWARGRAWALSGVLPTPQGLTPAAGKRITDLIADLRTAV